MNQIVASELLRGAGLVVDIAADGKAAVEQVRAADYDVVLMDMQMPVMDGVTATREIRRTHAAQRLPIIAMTANAMEAHRDICIDAGMNDYVAKPIDPDRLWAALLRNVARRPGQGERTATVPASPVSSDSSVVTADIASPVTPATVSTQGLPSSLPGVDLALGLQRTLGRPELYASLLVRFADQWDDAGTMVGDALASGDASTAQRVAHSVKGVAGMLGATQLQAAAAHLEDLIAARASSDALRGGIVELERELARVTEGIRLHLAQEPTPAPVVEVTVDREEVAETTGHLWRLLAEGDTSAAEVLHQHAPMLQATYGEALAPVRAAMDRFEYEEARDLLLQAARARDIRL